MSTLLTDHSDIDTKLSISSYSNVSFLRSLGMLKEAEIIEQQMIARGKVGVSGASRSSSPNDYSAQWAEYYR